MWALDPAVAFLNRPCRLLRVSCHIYNRLEDYARLAPLRTLLGR